MFTIRTATAALSIALAVVAAPAHADEGDPTPVETCLAAHPGAVAAADVTDENDTVCVDTVLIPSAGDDTYLWVGADLDDEVVLTGKGTFKPDPGTDTLSLADWSVPLVETYADNGYGGILGVRVVNIDSPEVVRYTDFDDVIGDPNLCPRMGAYDGSVTPISHYTGLGADTVRCTIGNIFTEGGDDTIVGVSDGTAIDAGSGDDTVTGDGTADVIDLGAGDDTADVTDGGADVVEGGTGTDTVDASEDDVLTGVEVARRVTAAKPPAVTQPVAAAPQQAAAAPQKGKGKHKHHKKGSCKKHGHKHSKHHR